MGPSLSAEELARTRPAESLRFASPVPTRMVSNGEFTPLPQTALQRQFERRLKELAEDLGRRQGMSRRAFLKTSAGMAAAFVAMNEVFGPNFVVSSAEAADPDQAAERARRLARQFVFDDQVHFLRDKTRHDRFIGLRGYTSGFLNPQMGDPGNLESLKFRNFVKEVFMDSDTKVALLSSAPSDNPEDWFLTNDETAAAKAAVNRDAGSQRMLCHAVLTPGQPGWLEEMDRIHATIKPDSWKGYTTGDPNAASKFMWRMDDEKLAYPAYERMRKAGVKIICVHKGLLPADAEKQMPGVTKHSMVDDVGRAAKDFPDITFVVYHAGYHPLPRPNADQERAFEQSGSMPWVSDLAALPEKLGVRNVYADIGASFALTATTNPRYCAGMLGTLIKGLGADHVFWGTDSIWFGSPQWQIEAFRRIEIPLDLQTKFGFAPLGDAEGRVKTAILGGNGAKLYGLRTTTAAAEPGWENDRFALMKAEYERHGTDRSNRAYGVVARG
jgi:predicted TIM-barrel fold metal-dependent hydrolase